MSQNSHKNIKKEILARMFACEFCEISHNTSSKEPLGRLLLHKHFYCLLSHHDLSLFKNDITHIFWLSIFSAEFVGWEEE